MRIVHNSLAGRVTSPSAKPGRATTSGHGRKTDSNETSDESESDEEDDDDEEEEEEDDDDGDEEEEKKNLAGQKEIYYCDVCGKKETKFPDLVYHRSVEHSFATGKDDGHKFMR